MDGRIAAGDGPGYYGLNLDLHALILRATRNERLVCTYEGLIKKLHLFRAKNWDNPSELRFSNAEHGDMVAALAARDEQAASETHFRHVMKAKARAAAAAEGVADGPTPLRRGGSRPRKLQERKP